MGAIVRPWAKDSGARVQLEHKGLGFAAGIFRMGIVPQTDIRGQQHLSSHCKHAHARHALGWVGLGWAELGRGSVGERDTDWGRYRLRRGAALTKAAQGLGVLVQEISRASRPGTFKIAIMEGCFFG